MNHSEDEFPELQVCLLSTPSSSFSHSPSSLNKIHPPIMASSLLAPWSACLLRVSTKSCSEDA